MYQVLVPTILGLLSICLYQKRQLKIKNRQLQLTRDCLKSTLNNEFQCNIFNKNLYNKDSVFKDISDSITEMARIAENNDLKYRDLKSFISEITSKAQENQSEINLLASNISTAYDNSNNVRSIIQEMIDGMKILVEEITQVNNEQLQKFNEQSQSINGKINAINEKSNDAMAAIRQINLISKETYGTIKDLNTDLEKIDSIADLVTDMIKKMNLLSLNAQIESARLGQAGKGFGVLAIEMQKFTGESERSLKNIIDITKNINLKTSYLFDKMDKFLKDMKSGEEKITDINEVLDDIYGDIQVTNKFTETVVERQSAHSITLNELIGVMSNLLTEIENIIRNIAHVNNFTEDIGNILFDLNKSLNEFYRDNFSKIIDGDVMVND